MNKFNNYFFYLDQNVDAITEIRSNAVTKIRYTENNNNIINNNYNFSGDVNEKRKEIKIYYNESDQKQILADYISSDDDDDNDTINIIINETKKIESCNELTKQYLYNSTLDLDLQNEINTLLKKSIKLRSSKCISLYVNNHLILVYINTPISSRLAILAWGQPLTYIKCKFPLQDEFNDFLNKFYLSRQFTTYNDGTDRTETIAFFSAVYKKTSIVLNNQQSKYNDDNTYNDCMKKRYNNNGLYRYYDFTLIILKSGFIIDYSIHSYKSNICDLITEYKPKCIYYNAIKDDPLDIFLNYQYQPFYESFKNLLKPISINKPKRDDINYLAFCERNELYCSFCLALREIRAFIFQNQVQQTIVQKIKKQYTNYRKYPTQLHLMKAPKKMGRYQKKYNKKTTDLITTNYLTTTNPNLVVIKCE